MRVARIVLAVWLTVLAAFWITSWWRGADPLEVTQAALAAAGESPWAPLGLLAAYAVRSVLFLPMTLLTVFAGFLLGPWWGAAVALVGSVASALISYALARFVGITWTARGDPLRSRGPEAPVGWRGRLARAPFQAVLLARLAAVPGDAVNVAAGVWRIPWLPFAAATGLGGVPGILAGAWAGAAIEGDFAFRSLQLRPGFVGLSVAMLTLSLAISLALRRRARRRAGRRP